MEDKILLGLIIVGVAFVTTVATIIVRNGGPIHSRFPVSPKINEEDDGLD